jgi:hypothetical protein
MAYPPAGVFLPDGWPPKPCAAATLQRYENARLNSPTDVLKKIPTRKLANAERINERAARAIGNGRSTTIYENSGPTLASSEAIARELSVNSVVVSLT